MSNPGVAEIEAFADRNAAQGEPLPRRWIELADELAPNLWASAAKSLIHTDLHYGNILAGVRQPWLAIDPRPLACDPERSVSELMWWRLDLDAKPALIHTLLETLASAGDLDAERARCWTIVRVVSYWLWCLQAGLTEDPLRCRLLLEALA